MEQVKMKVQVQVQIEAQMRALLTNACYGSTCRPYPGTACG